MRIFRSIVFLTFFLCGVFLLIPLDAGAAGFVPCGQITPDECNFGHLIILGTNLVNFAVLISVPILTALFAYGGFLYLVSGTAPAKRQLGNKVMTGGVVGFAIVLLAWLGVNLILTLFVDEDQFNTSVDTILTPR